MNYLAYNISIHNEKETKMMRSQFHPLWYTISVACIPVSHSFHAFHNFSTTTVLPQYHFITLNH